MEEDEEVQVDRADQEDQADQEEGNPLMKNLLVEGTNHKVDWSDQGASNM